MVIKKFVDDIQKKRYSTLLDKAGVTAFDDKEMVSFFYIIASDDKLFGNIELIYNFHHIKLKVDYKRCKSKLSNESKTMFNLALQLYDPRLNHSSVNEVFESLSIRNEEIAIRAIHYRFFEKRRSWKNPL